MENFNNSIIDDMARFIGQTVTIFTTSGGLSGSGFTGVLISVDCKTVKLLCSVGWPPSCPLGNNCTNSMTPYGIANNNNNGYGFGGRRGCGCNYGNCGNYGSGFGNYNPLGSVTIIPTCAIASFTHNAI